MESILTKHTVLCDDVIGIILKYVGYIRHPVYNYIRPIKLKHVVFNTTGNGFCVNKNTVLINDNHYYVSIDR
jgi:hypothetical protein